MPDDATIFDPVEQVRQSLEVVNRGDLAAASKFLASDGVWDTSRNGFGIFRGTDAIRRFWEDWFSAYEEIEGDFDELVDVGSGVVFGVVRQKARPVGATGYIHQREGWIWVWTDGVCASVTVYPEGEIDEARTAAERLAEARNEARMAESPPAPGRGDIVRRAIEAGNRHDFDGALAPYAPHAVWDMSRVGMGEIEGRNAIRAFFEAWTGSYEGYHMTLQEHVDYGNGVTLIVCSQSGSPSGSTAVIDTRYVGVAIWDDDLITRSTQYIDIDEARAAAERLAEERG